MKPMLARTFENQDPTGWLLSEKLDGVRAIWDGARLLTRNGNEIQAPAWFTAALPSIPLDGELWEGRGKFQSTVGAVRQKTPSDSRWQSIRFMVFDAPAAPGGFEKRLALAASALGGNAVAAIVPHVCCQSRPHMERYAATLIAEGAEGIMLRAPGSPYEQKRSWHLLKYKVTFTDEARLVGYEDGKGKNAGLLGALVCIWRGVTFGVGTGITDLLRERPPQIGALVTFSYNGVTDGGCPRFPAFVCVRDYE